MKPKRKYAKRATKFGRKAQELATLLSQPRRDKQVAGIIWSDGTVTKLQETGDV